MLPASRAGATRPSYTRPRGARVGPYFLGPVQPGHPAPDEGAETQGPSPSRLPFHGTPWEGISVALTGQGLPGYTSPAEVETTALASRAPALAQRGGAIGPEESIDNLRGRHLCSGMVKLGPNLRLGPR